MPCDFGAGPFWSFLTDMKNKIDERLPNERVSYIWNNIVKAEYHDDAKPDRYKVPSDIYAKFLDVNRRLILGEIEIIRPDVLVFFTGAESSGYDIVMDDVFGDGMSVIKVDIDIDGNKNILARASLPKFGDAYISYHPLGLQLHAGRKAKDIVLNRIAEQCAIVMNKGRV